MPKGLRVTALGNRIEWVTHNGKGLITGKRQDVTDEAIKAVFQHLMQEHAMNNKGTESFGYGFEGLGEIHFHPLKDATNKGGVGMKGTKHTCDTCQGEGEVYQESGAGIHATANLGWVDCPDCDGDGFWIGEGTE